MTAVRIIMVAACAAPLLMTVVAGPAGAHGAMGDPVSRTVACGPEGGRAAQSKACRAAMAVSDPRALRAWDNLRVAGVGGRDRQVIPDGRLCSGGLAAYKGLDLARADWPATRLTSGARFTFTYPETIPHRGTFKLYVTKDGYDPTRRLSWSDLEPRPFLAAADPPLRGGAYVIKGRLPRGKHGRHMIYTIWQNSDTPDTYYSCSDVVFGGRRASSAPAASAPRATESEDADVNRTTIDAENKSTRSALPMAAGGGAVLLALAAGAAILFIRRRRAR